MLEMTKIPTVRDFKVVTATKNKLVKGLKASTSVDLKIQYVQEHFPEALEEYTSVIFEQAGMSEDIEEEVALNFLGRLDFQKVFTEERIADSQFKEAKLLSLIEKVDRTNEQMIEKMDKLDSKKSDKHVLAKIEKVRSE